MSEKASAEPAPSGSKDTRDFYDREGWKEQDGQLRDVALFGVRDDGPIRKAAHARRMSRLLAHFRALGPELNLLECGCGGNPEPAVVRLCARYTGVDFSRTGVEAARKTLSPQPVPFELIEGDICQLPFTSSAFDAVYSAHAIYHIPDPAAQRAAFSEAMRVTRPGGVAVFVLANPHPWAFPLRFAQRLAADTPGLSRVLRALRPKPMLPYQPMPLGWMRRVLEPFGSVAIEVHAMASTWFNQRVPEDRGLGRAAWRLIEKLERDRPALAARLGNYVQIAVLRE